MFPAPPLHRDLRPCVTYIYTGCNVNELSPYLFYGIYVNFLMDSSQNLRLALETNGGGSKSNSQTLSDSLPLVTASSFINKLRVFGESNETRPTPTNNAVMKAFYCPLLNVSGVGPGLQRCGKTAVRQVL